MIFRTVKRENPFVQIDKTCLYDDNLSFKAKGLLVYMLSRPDGWKFYLSEIVTNTREGKASVSSGIKELEEAGYLVRHQERKDNGDFGQYIYLVYERPHTTDIGISDIGLMETENMGSANMGSHDSGPINIEGSNKDSSNSITSTSVDGYQNLINTWNDNCGGLAKIRTIRGSRRKLVQKALKEFPEDLEEKLRIATTYVSTNYYYLENGYGFDNCLRNLEVNYQKGKHIFTKQEKQKQIQLAEQRRIEAEQAHLAKKEREERERKEQRSQTQPVLNPMFALIKEQNE